MWATGDLPLPARPGTVLAAVTSVLLRAGKPQAVSGIYAAVLNDRATHVPRSSVNAALSSHWHGADALFRRVRFGVYEFGGGLAGS